MNLRPRTRQSAEINLTPLIDVVFLLLIFFMVSTTFREDARLRLRLPSAEGEPPSAQQPGPVAVSIDRRGRFFVGERPLAEQTPAALEAALAAAFAERQQALLVIRADAEARHQAVITALDVAGRLGVERIAFAASREQEREPAVRGTNDASAGPRPGGGGTP